MRKSIFAAALLSLLLLAGCRAQNPAGETDPQTTAPAATAAAETTASPEKTAPPETTAPQEPIAPQTAPAETAAPETGPATTAPAPTAETTTQSAVEERLSISLPRANGSMEISLEADNVYISAVAARGIDPALLAAVYTVPQNGQNYVFEFTGPDRTADALRRVYLLDENAAVRSVAAADDAERENISVAENWFCMNVLIKGVVFPAVKDRLAGR